MKPELIDGEKLPVGRHSEGVAKGTQQQQEAQATKNETKVVKAVVKQGNTHVSKS